MAQIALALFNIRAGQSKAKGSCADVEFRAQDVEPLLEQATIILNQAAADLFTAQTLGEKLATLRCDLMQFFAVDKILVQEEGDKKYEVDEKATKSQYDANEARVTALKDAATNRESLSQRIGKDTTEGEAAQIRAGSIAYVRAQYNEEKACGGNIYYSVPDKPDWYNKDNHNAKIDVDLALTKKLYEYGQTNDRYSVLAALAEVKAQLDSSQASRTGLEAQMKWAEKNTTYLSKRAKAIRDVMRYKAALADPGSGDLLDFDSRMKQIKERYQEELADAYCRLQAVEKGLQQIYHYNNALPKLLADDPKIFEHILAWARGAAAWLAAMTRRSHNYVLPISIRRQCGDAAWQEGKKRGEWHFKIDEKLFDENERHIRIRGMCGWCSGEDGPYVLDLTPPEKTWIHAIRESRIASSPRDKMIDSFAPAHFGLSACPSISLDSHRLG